MVVQAIMVQAIMAFQAILVILVNSVAQCMALAQAWYPNLCLFSTRETKNTHILVSQHLLKGILQCYNCIFRRALKQ
jgi:hypothetical protein